MTSRFDVIIIGGGHAGAEAAWAAARLGANTALVTFRRDAIGRMSCNPAIGGIGKGQMVREIDALGGLMGIVADQTGIQFRMLNRRKGPAMWAPRCQSDSAAYAARVREHLEACQNLTILEGSAEALLFSELPRCESGHKLQITGLRFADGTEIHAPAIIVTAGTFLGALMHCGEQKTAGGRVGEAAAVGLSDSLRNLGLTLGRLKTGTPPRVHRDSVDFRKLAEQPGDDPPTPFSFLHDRIEQPQVSCWITYTNPAVHELLRANLHRAPMYSGQIESRGPRYCPSVEDKVVRFADKEQHQVFLEPEGRDSERIYCNGISTSTPQDVQERMLALIPGLENACVVQWGYAVEYDFVLPEQNELSLMNKRVRGLFFAGQINGTSGYEEAAGQGLIAGINAARFVARQDPLLLGRDQSYIGVMIEDLVTQGVTEPYRMFTSRAEHRLHLRYDNADQRLTPLGRSAGLVGDMRWNRFQTKQSRLATLRGMLRTLRCNGATLQELLRRPEVDGAEFSETFPELKPYQQEADLWALATVEARYAGYLERQQRQIESHRAAAGRLIPLEVNYRSIPQMRREAVERLEAVRPTTVGQASRISGIHPVDIAALLLYLTAQERAKEKLAAPVIQS